MCGRFTLRTPSSLLVESFMLPGDLQLELPLRYNIAPTQLVTAVRWSDSAEARQMAALRWGLIPSWAKDARIGNRMINARSETAAEKPAFRAAFRRRRCLIAADGYYEWKREGKQKQPYYFRRRDDGPFAFAGLWESWSPPDGERVLSCTILTTDANDLSRPIHDRMPVILPPEQYDLWLDPEFEAVDPLRQLLCPYTGDDLRADPVSTLVNNPRHDQPECIELVG